MIRQVLLLMTTSCVCTPPPPEHEVVRRSGVRIALGDEGVQLQAPVLYWPDRGGRLVGAVHVGEPSYYEAVAAQLASASTVLFEGLTDDEAIDEPSVERLGLDAYDLARQGEALVPDPRWVHADTSLSSLRQQLLDADAPPDVVHAMLDDRDQSTLAELFADTPEPRQRALRRLALVQHIGEPSPSEGPEADAYWNVIVGWRNELVDVRVQAHADEPWAVVYGADHVWDLAARVHPDAAPEVTWIPVIEVAHAELELGAVQVRQLLDADR